MSLKLSATIALAVSIGACAPEEPQALPTNDFVGCYRATGSPSFDISATALRVEDGPTVPLHFEMRRVGLVLAVPLKGEVNSGRLTFSNVRENYNYRAFQRGNDRAIRIIGSETPVVYTRTSIKPCPM